MVGDEAARLLAACGPHLRDLVVAALESGCRKQELLSLQWTQVLWPQEEVAADLVGTDPLSRYRRSEVASFEAARVSGCELGGCHDAVRAVEQLRNRNRDITGQLLRELWLFVGLDEIAWLVQPLTRKVDRSTRLQLLAGSTHRAPGDGRLRVGAV